MAVKPIKKGKGIFIEKDKRKSYMLKRAKEQAVDIISKGEGNISALLNKLIDKVDSLGKKSFVNDNYFANALKKDNGAVEIDIKRNLFLAKPDKSNINLDYETNKKVNNKVDKLRKLRGKNNGS